jgi:iron complex transport system ATP-binding protein
MSLHDINLAARFCSHLLLLLPGGRVLSGTCAELLNVEVLTQLYRHPMVCIHSDDGIAFLPR